MNSRVRNIFGWLLVAVGLVAMAWGWIAAKHETQLMQARDAAMRELLNGSDYGFAIMDINGEIIEWNEALAEWSGYKSDEMKGKSIEFMMLPEVADKHKKAFTEAMRASAKNGFVHVVFCSLIDRWGKPVDVRVSVRVVRPRGEPPYAIAHIDRANRVVESAEGNAR